MEIIKTTNEGLEDLPRREIWYFGPKIVSCSNKTTVSHKNYNFELYKYDIKSNGKNYVNIFDSDEKQVFENLTISLEYCWIAGYTIEFYNSESPRSECYFHYKVKTDFDLEKVLDRIVLMAEKNKKRIIEYISYQHMYAYIIFLFFPIKNENIRATEFSDLYKSLKKIRACISGQLTDNANSKSYSKDTVYYKVFDRFNNRKLEEFKSKIILYD